jgi:uncharacterized protein (DUF2141 family)
MKMHLLVSGFITLGFTFLAPLACGADLTVTVSDIRSQNGQLLVAVVNTDAAWNSREKPVAVDKADATAREQVFRFKLPAGSYAVQVLHDENRNGKLDSNFMGIPVEGYGFSNNPQVMRRAHFSEAKFDLTEAPAAIVVRLR